MLNMVRFSLDHSFLNSRATRNAPCPAKLLSPVICPTIF